ncbi:MAG TPA: RNA 2',3'-cyclic phosphodiesterase, partial [Lachnospiraceae bacterium]|nr:RNA 2',3'-cyclic phosphodiesterase [Lachnospiraceae bacterium]
MRLFIAINFTERMKDDLDEMVNNLKKQSESGTFTRKENLHLTLAFLGEVSKEEVTTIVDVMEHSVIPAFTLTISEFGKFRIQRESLYWCGVRMTESLKNLQGKLLYGLKIARFAPDDKPYKPHITLGRRCKMKESFSENDFQNSLPEMVMQVEKISLMKSERVKGILTYTEVVAVRLLDNL